MAKLPDMALASDESPWMILNFRFINVRAGFVLVNFDFFEYPTSMPMPSAFSIFIITC